MQNRKYIQTYLTEVKRICDAVSQEAIGRAIEILFSAWKENRTVFVMGNGGSASTATRFAANLVKQTMIAPPEKRLRALSLSDNVPLVSSLTNDDGWENLYIEQLKSFACRGDVGIGISIHGGSGKDKAGAWSQNLLKALQYLKDSGGPTIGFIGFDGGPMKTLVDVPMVIPADSTPQVEGFHGIVHQMIVQRLREKIEESLNASYMR